MDEMDGMDVYRREQGLVVVGVVVEFLVVDVASVVGILGLVGGYSVLLLLVGPMCGVRSSYGTLGVLGLPVGSW